jgi:hypothetical protein
LLMMIMKMMMERRILLENVTCGELPLLLWRKSHNLYIMT